MDWDRVGIVHAGPLLFFFRSRFFFFLFSFCSGSFLVDDEDTASCGGVDLDHQGLLRGS